MGITSLGLHITDRCNAKCLHCAFACGPNFRGHMRVEEARHYLVDAKALDAEIVCITGGEPMLYPNSVRRIISECVRLSFPEIWLFTNAFWAHCTSKAHATVEKLRSLGLTKMFTSIDFFHQGYIPIESVRNMVEASVKSSLEVCVDARFIGQADEEKEFDSATRSHLKFLGDFLSKVEVTKAQPMFIGRAPESLAKQVKMKSLREILNDRCPGAWAGGTLESPLGVDVDELGFATICPGLSIGNARQASFRKIVEKYDYDYHNYAVIAALYDYGAKGLMNLASEKGFAPKEAYVSACHFCYEVRKFLRDIFPDAFTLST